MTDASPKLGPLPVVWSGHPPALRARDMYRTGERMDRNFPDYDFDPRPGYSQNEEDYS